MAERLWPGHAVVLPFKVSVRQEPINDLRHQVLSEMRDSTYKGSFSIVTDYHADYIFSFSDEDTAILFKLRFG